MILSLVVEIRFWYGVEDKGDSVIIVENFKIIHLCKSFLTDKVITKLKVMLKAKLMGVG